MIKFFQFLENLSFSRWVHEANTIWAFPMILFVHTLGIIHRRRRQRHELDLMVLGFRPAAMPIKPFSNVRVPDSVYRLRRKRHHRTQRCLLGDATAKLTTPDFYLKMHNNFVRPVPSHTNAAADISGSANRPRPVVGQCQNAGLGFVVLLVRGLYLRSPAGLYQAAGHRQSALICKRLTGPIEPVPSR